MAAAKSKSDSASNSEPSSAPELSEDQKRQLESKLTIVSSESSIEAGKEVALPEANSVVGKSVEESGELLKTSELTAEDGPAEPEQVQSNKLKRYLEAYWRRKRWTIPVTFLALVSILAAVPATRYGLASYIVSQPVSITVVDAATKRPVTSANVKLNGQILKTDKDGKAVIGDVKVGTQRLSVSKKYYKDQTITIFVPLTKGVNMQINVTATGRQVPIVVVNKISGKPLENVTLQSSGTEVKTNKEGKATIVLPADKVDLPIELNNGGFNALEARVKVTDQVVKENTFALVPTGKVYFLSRQSGKIDVVKTDLDGANRQVVVQGTGREENTNTVLLASRDWRYLALLSKRDSSPARLYLIDVVTDKMSEMDSGDATFTLIGWNNHDFVYQVSRNKVKFYEPNQTAIKSFNADKKQLLTVDQTVAQNDPGNYYHPYTGGTSLDEASIYYQLFSNAQLINTKLVYAVTWQAINSSWPVAPALSKRSHSIREVPVGSNDKKEVKTWRADQYHPSIQTVPYKKNAMYAAISSMQNWAPKYYDYESGTVKEVEINEQKFNTPYPTYLESPDGKKTFWSEQRDGRATFFIGDASGENGRQAAVIDDGQVYGWYGDSYVLVSKKSSELYIMPADSPTPFKIADYHKPQVSYRGYGGGYGGL